MCTSAQMTHNSNKELDKQYHIKNQVSVLKRKMPYCPNKEKMNNFLENDKKKRKATRQLVKCMGLVQGNYDSPLVRTIRMLIDIGSWHETKADLVLLIHSHQSNYTSEQPNLDRRKNCAACLLQIITSG